MDYPLEPGSASPPRRGAILVTALAPLFPQLLGSVFNIWYNLAIIEPLLRASGLRERFVATVIVWNAIAYPAAVAVWLWFILSLRPAFRELAAGGALAPAFVNRLRRRLVNLPWVGAFISGTAWFLCIPVFLLALAVPGKTIGLQLLWHLPISLAVSGFIAVTQSFFLIELASHWGLFPVFFRTVRADLLEGIHPISLRTRGLMWAISAGVCPISSLLLLIFAPAAPGSNPQWFGFFVGTIGIGFGLCSAVLIGRSVVQPVDQLRVAAQAVTDGQLHVEVPLRRADEFGALIGEFNRMVVGLREKEQMRRTFGAHVGRQVAEEILARDPGVGGTEEIVTVMFVDIRSFTARAGHLTPQRAVALLNEFLSAMVRVVEDLHGGMINKFLGDGFMAIFGVGADGKNHADQAVAAAAGLQKAVVQLNSAISLRGETPIAIGIGINTGPTIVGSIGSPERMEFTVIGNTVNVASRIEALNKTLGTTLLVSQTTRDALSPPHEMHALPPQSVKGVDELVAVFTTRDGETT